MSTGELVNLIFLAFVSGGLGVTFWRRLSEIRTELKDDTATLRGEIRDEMANLRQEMAIMRSDLTQVALAVGARPRASND